MPSLEEFRTLLAENADEAMKQYAVLIDAASLDYVPGEGDARGFDEFKVVTVVFEYDGSTGTPIIMMRAKNPSDAGGKQVSYLPWKNAASGAIAVATLDGDGPEYFSTSQLDGCRFSIQYHDADHKKVTVQHLAGDVLPNQPKGQSGTDGSAERDRLEAQGMPNGADPQLRRRYSIGSGPGKMGQVGRNYKTSRADTLYYDGGKAFIFGYRNKNGAWVFYAAEMNSANKGLGLKNLWTKSSVTGPLNTNAQA